MRVTCFQSLEGKAWLSRGQAMMASSRTVRGSSRLRFQPLLPAELVKTKKRGGEERWAKKPQSQQGDRHEARSQQIQAVSAPPIAAVSEMINTGCEMPIVCPLQPYSDPRETRRPQTSAAVSSGCEESSNSQATTLQSHLPPEVISIFKSFMREEMLSFCKEGGFG